MIVAGPAGPTMPWMPPSKKTPVPADGEKLSESFCQISDPNILLISFKTADDDRGHILRLLEISGKSTQAEIRFGPLAVSKVTAVDAVEQEFPPEEREESKLAGKGIATKFRPFELKTLRVFFSN
jgi:alpha-mannosidase